MKPILIILAVFIFFCGCAEHDVRHITPKYAEQISEVESLLHSRVTVEINAMSFSEAVSFLSNSTGLNLCISTDVPSGEEMKDIRITVHAVEQVLSEILDDVCGQANMRWTYPSPDIPEEYRYSKVAIEPEK